MKKIILLVILLFSFAKQTEGQTHPCDVTVAPNPTAEGTVVKVGFCQPTTKADGSPITVTSFKIFSGVGTNPIWQGMLVGGPANSAGHRYYESPNITFPLGNRSIRVTVVDAGGLEASSLPFTFTLVEPPPVPLPVPLLVRIVK